MGQQASSQSGTSSQTIHDDADTLISTSGSSNNEALGYDANAAIEVESDTDNIDSDVYDADAAIEVESDAEDSDALDLEYNADRVVDEESETEDPDTIDLEYDADAADSDSEELEYDVDRVISDRSRVRNPHSDSVDLEYDAEAEDSDSEEMEWVQETSKFLLEACESKNWEIFQMFLSDKSITKRKKILVLDENEECRDLALRWGAPWTVIKYLINIEGPDAISKGNAHGCIQQ